MKRNQFPRTCWTIATLSENFVWITGLHLLELPCWELMLYDSSTQSPEYPQFLHPQSLQLSSVPSPSMH